MYNNHALIERHHISQIICHNSDGWNTPLFPSVMPMFRRYLILIWFGQNVGYSGVAPICQVYEAEFLCSNHQWDPMIELNAWYASLYLKNLPIYVEFLGNHFLPKFNVTAWLAHLDAKMDIFSGSLSGFICNHHLATRKHQNLWL